MNGNGSAPLSFEAYISSSEFERGIAALNRGISGFTKNAVSETQKVNDTFKQLGQLAAGAFAFNELASLPKKLIDVRGEFQNLEIAYTTMLGSKAKADALFEDVVKFAATTPFDLQGVASASKQLLAYGIASEDVLGTLRRLGDISAGLTIPLGELTELYGKTKTNGRLFAEDLNQYVGRGIPLIKLLADQFQVAESEVRGLVETGKVGFPEVQKAIGKLTDSGGMFAGLTEEQSKGLKGLYANFEDVIAQAFNNIGKEQEGLLGDSIKFATSVVENYNPILDALKVIIATYGTYKAAVIATAAVQALPAAKLFITEYFAMGNALGFATANQIAYNAAVIANPYAIAAAALVALITAVALFRDTSSEAEKAQARLSLVNDRVTNSLAGELGKIELLTAQIKNENVSRAERNKKLQELISIHPQILSGITLENIATENGTKAINNYIEARKRQIEVEQLKVELDESIKRQLDAKNNKNQTSFLSDIGTSMSTMGSGFTAGTKGTDYLKVQAEERKKLNAKIEREEIDFQKGILEKVAALQTKAAKEEKPKVFKNVPYYDEEIKKLKELQALQSGNNAKFVLYQKQIDDLEKAKNRITGKRTDAEIQAAKAAEKDADKSGPYGSIDYWDYIANKAREVLSKTPIDQKDKVDEQVKIISEAEKNAQDARKAVTVLSFQEELEEKKKKYELYHLWVDNYTKEAANSQFAGLVSQGDSYASYLDGEIKKLEAKKSIPGVGLTDPEKEQFVKLKVEYSDATNAEKPLETFQKHLDDIRNSATSLTDEIEKLKAVQLELGTTKMDPTSITERQLTQQQLNQATSERTNQFRSFLVEVAGSEQKRLDIESRFQSQREELEKQYGAEKGEIYEKTLASINAAEQEEYEKDKAILAEKSKEFKAFAKIMQKSNEDLSGGDIKTARENFKTFTANLDKNSDEYKKYLRDLEDLEEKHKQKSIQTWGLVADGIGQLGSVMSELGGSVGEVGSALSGLSGQFGNISSAFSTNQDGTTSMNQYAAAIQGVIQIVGTLVSASKKRHEAEEAFALARLGFENDYQLALNTSLGQSYKEKENPYVKDFDAKIKAGVDQYADAQKKYEDAIDKLNEGKAKERQKNVVDGKTVGQLAGAGAAAGAVIGGIVGVGVFSVATAAVGAVIGGAIGAISGLFAKKKKDVYGGLMEEYPDLVKQGADGWKSIDVEMARALITNNQVDDKTKEMLQTAIEYNDALQESKQQINDSIVELTGQMGDSIKNALETSFQEGTNAAQAFGDAVGDIMGNVVKNLLFAKLMKPAFDKFIEEANASYSIGGDGTLIDDLDRLNDYGLPNAEAYVQSLEEFNKWAKEKGFDDVFNKTSDASKDPLSGAIQGMSQETAGILAGQFNAIRITNADISQSMRQSLIHLSAISQNTSYNKNLLYLADMVDELKKLNSGNSMRFTGG